MYPLITTFLILSSDLYACIFVSVIYTKETLSIGAADTFDNSTSMDDDFPLSISDNGTFMSKSSPSLINQ